MSAKAGASLKQSAVDLAIKNCCQNFPTFENLAENLKVWLDCIELRELAVATAATEVSIEQLSSLFIDVTSFYDGDNTEKSAQEIVSTFLSELVLILRAEIDFNLSVIEQLQRQTLAEVSSIKQSTINSTVGDDGAVRRSEEQHFHSVVDTARSLLKSGNPRAALKVLQAIRDELEREKKQVSSDVLYRIAWNIGSCLLELDEWVDARTEYELAIRLKSDSWKALANLAHLCELSGDSAEAVKHADKAFELNPEDTYVCAIRILAYHSANKVALIETQLLDANRCDNATILLALGQVSYDQKRYSEAANIFQKVIDREPNNSLAKVMKAQSLLMPIQERFDETKIRGVQLIDSETKALEHAAKLLTDAISSMAANESTPGLSRARLALISVQFFLGDDDGAISTCESVMSSDSFYLFAQRAKGLILFTRGDLEAARQALSKVRDSGDPQTILALAEIYNEQKLFANTIELLKPLLEKQDLESHFRLAAIERALFAHWRSGSSDTAQLEERLVQLEQNGVPEAVSIRAIHLLRQNKNDEAIEILQNALQHADTKKDSVRQVLMYAYCVADRLSDALQTYEDLENSTYPSGELKALLMKLSDSDIKSQALPILKSLRDQHGPLPGFAEIEVGLLADIGEVDLAREILRRLSDREPDNYRYRLNMIALCSRLGQEDMAKQLLAELNESSLANDGKSLMRLAYSYLSLGIKDPVLPLAFRSRQLLHDNPDIHLAYVDIFVRLNPKFDSTEAKADCTITLRRGDHSIEHTLVNENPTDPRSHTDLPISDPLAQLILGKKQGDSVIIRSDQFGQLEYTVQLIRHKYVAAYVESLTNFTARFPTEQGLRAVEDRNLVQLFASIEHHHQRALKIEQLYRSGSLPLESVSELAGVSPIDFWLATIFGTSVNLLARTGRDEDLRREFSAVSDAKELVVDLTALLTLTHLGLHDDLIKLGKPIFLSQFTFDELTLRLFDLLERRVSYLGKAGDKYRISEYTEDDHKRRRQLIQSARSFAAGNTTTLGMGALKSQNLDDLDIKYKTVGRAAYASLLLAYENGRCIVSDDLCLRRLGQGEFQMAGCSTYELIRLLFERKIIDEERYKQLVILLAQSNFYFLPIRAEDLSWALEQSGGTVTPAVAKVVNLLADPAVDADTAAIVGAEFLRLVWFRVVIPDQRQWAVEILLSALIKNRPPRRVLTMLERQVRSQFHLMPHHGDQVFEIIRFFRAVRGI